MKIVVTTPTGNVGSHVARLLVQAGTRPTLLLRDAARLDPAMRERVDVVEGSQADPDTVLRATADADVLHWVAPPTEDYSALGQIAADAVREHGIGHVVFQSSVGAELRSGAGEIDGLGRTEELLDATGASVCHLRCGMFFSNLLMEPLDTGVLRVTWPLDRPMPWVAPRDVAEVTVARLLATGAWSGRVVQAVHGPEDLTYAQVAEIVGVRAERIPDDAMREALRGAGLHDAAVEGIVGMSIGLRDATFEDERSVLTTTPTTLGAWAAEHL